MSRLIPRLGETPRRSEVDERPPRCTVTKRERDEDDQEPNPDTRGDLQRLLHMSEPKWIRNAALRPEDSPAAWWVEPERAVRLGLPEREARALTELSRLGVTVSVDRDKLLATAGGGAR